ncbi:unnamed protein product [Ostreobium quekettii]|uniref:Uncharacterized protein n=1 Tax=Ostreobium quekettii TaxID=121088 RepID=A0A8S1JBM8_9CHLO|nr:unnamed protein product [Ostreobium quekettii]
MVGWGGEWCIERFSSRRISLQIHSKQFFHQRAAKALTRGRKFSASTPTGESIAFPPPLRTLKKEFVSRLWDCQALYCTYGPLKLLCDGPTPVETCAMFDVSLLFTLQYVVALCRCTQRHTYSGDWWVMDDGTKIGWPETCVRNLGLVSV